MSIREEMAGALSDLCFACSAVPSATCAACLDTATKTAAVVAEHLKAAMAAAALGDETALQALLTELEDAARGA